MSSNCDYCGSPLKPSEEKCPACGATNAHYVKTAISQPKTIEELKQWYKEKNLPVENITRFFIGKDVKYPKAFGIYRDANSGKVIVYKNKADGTRAIRYEGSDEEFAVNEIFQKLRETITIQKENNRSTTPSNNPQYWSTTSKKTKKKKSIAFWVIVGIIIFLFVGCCAILLSGESAYGKYYRYKGDYYYNFNGKYYTYDDGDWSYYGYDAPFDEDDYERYQVDYEDEDLSDFEDSSAYQDWYDNYNSSNDDDDDDWDSGWDSGDSWDSDYGSDWDSDW